MLNKGGFNTFVQQLITDSADWAPIINSKTQIDQDNTKAIQKQIDNSIIEHTLKIFLANITSKQT